MKVGALIGVLMAMLVPMASTAQEAAWQPYSDDASGYQVDLPTGLLDSYETENGVIRMRDDGLDTLLEVYAGTNPDGLSLDSFIDFLSEADRIAEVTYRTGGRTWFVISGYYRRDEVEPGPLIFYAKFMFSPDLKRFAAFEISYPQALKLELDPIVERLQASLRAPG